MIVTVARYRAVTNDNLTAQSVVEFALDDAVALLEDDLGRPLAAEERTETMWRDRAGWLRPAAVPIVSVATAGWTKDGDHLRPTVTWQPAHDPFTSIDSTVEITYTGGWVERSANPSAPNQLPASIELDLCWAAHALCHADELARSAPAGATSLRLGDVSVTFGGTGPRTALDATVRWSRRTMRWVRRR